MEEAHYCGQREFGSMFPTQAVPDSPSMLGPLISPRFLHIFHVRVSPVPPQILLSHFFSSIRYSTSDKHIHPVARTRTTVCGTDRFEKCLRISPLFRFISNKSLSCRLPSHPTDLRKETNPPTDLACDLHVKSAD